MNLFLLIKYYSWVFQYVPFYCKIVPIYKIAFLYIFLSETFFLAQLLVLNTCHVIFVIRMPRSFRDRIKRGKPIIIPFQKKIKKVIEWIFFKGEIFIIDGTTASQRKEHIHK